VLTPDFGNSGSVSYGTFDLRDLTPANDGLLISSVALDMTMGYNATQPCVECCGFIADSPTFDPYPAEVVVDGIEQTGIDAVSACSDDTSYISSYYATWGSLNPSIAAVTAKQVQGVAAGTTTGTAAGTIPTPGSCVCTLYSSRPQVPVTVQVPTSLSVLNVTVLPDGPGPPDGCPASLNYGIKIDIKYQVLDQNGAAIQSAGMTPYENGTFFTGGGYSGNIGPVSGYPTSSLTTAADGTFHDVPLGICQAYPIGSAGLTSLQHITIIVPDGSTPAVRTQTSTVTAPGSQSFGHGSISNSIGDISATR
jgi:hypothetical protein